MSFKYMAGTAIVPTLSRLVLGLAFVTVGYNKLATTSEFGAADAETLRQLGVSVSSTGTDLAGHPGAVSIVTASLRQEAPGASGEGEATEDAAEEGAEETPATAEPPADDAPPVAAAPEVRYRAATRHKVTLLCHNASWPYPKALALLAAITECLGGALLLIGFLSRLWGLAIAMTMGVAFYLVSMKLLHVHTTNPFQFASDVSQFNTVFNQLGLFVLALGILLTGPGPLSLDRILFRRGEGSSRGALR